MEKEKCVLAITIAVFTFSLIMLFLQSGALTGYATEGSAVSNVTISKFLSIELSANLGTGILFGTISTLPASNHNATNNYDGGSDESTMSVNVSHDSNTDVDICIKANDHLTDPGSSDVILLGNETYSNGTVTNATSPFLTAEVALTTGYVNASSPISPDSSCYYRFWLDVPSATPSGDYNNSVTFKGVETTTGC